ncbi:MAG: MogA/MoaB family molybdenum cofactor biosynthesis protein [Planctomycetia bacterium]|nr:MogA/MoaB family molybdenum cofactor biosynthesis protein [Planctomycetia bacterium]
MSPAPPPDSVSEHRASSPRRIQCAVITVSDTRTPETDTGGATAIDLLNEFGHHVVVREVIRDEPTAIRAIMESLRTRDDIDAILLTGGTGLGSRDQTFETISSLLTKTLPGYGELFRMLSYAEIGAAAMLSRAVGGLIDKQVVLTMPGSPAGVRLAVQQLIGPELAHLVREAKR